MPSAINCYLDLMKKCLLNLIYGKHEAVILRASNRFFKKQIINFFNLFGLQLMRPVPMDREQRISGKDWPPHAHTMIGLKRLDVLQFCVEDLLKNNVPGDFIEAGVWRGGASIFMKAILEAYDVKNRVVWVADSFEGLPKPDPVKYPQDKDCKLWADKALAVSLEEVKANFEVYGLLDNQVKFLKGWFKDTLPKADIKKLALMRLDGDMYESLTDSLTNLYPKLSVGGYVIVDDYKSITACRRAVDDYRKSMNITSKIIDIDWSGVYWRRED